ncbi:CPBP family intramembrane metalloprotease [Enterococcus durans]|uniref:CPBP family intramembrane glutamic endopeptidase n=1 Tax=Enterococcus durans TaxID=53345 RepID=UPI001191037C|nr:CPBP family intramembrane glutamic endopeptidase [Enterococcus durans]MBE9886377.1 CPBP family intramembrane metalloprotease [Enterococcus durans]MDB1652195.1 CPBP family intramembrane metalloprotease [Enterococcus durans]MDB1655437.1 CPBP family intramembrane metalloprotease [Enterococcus durans]MDB1663090.1 CPBP family intramembrane metalloprotease [Enterococcus durans]MDB1668235.1 CPBP family intramembrane metalloprotease [Enterococcus durans]
MKELMTKKMNKIGILIAILGLTIGYAILTIGVPIIESVSLAAGGFIGLYSLFGMEGLKAGFKKPKKGIVTFLVSYVCAVVLSLVMSSVVKNILHASTAANEVTDHLSATFIIETLPMLLGEELLAIVILVIVANLLGGTRKAIVAGILVSSVIFGLLHLPTYQWNLLQCLLIIGVGRIPFTVATLKSDSIWAGYFVHVAYDWIAFIVILLSMK